MGHDWVTGRQRGRFERIQRGRDEARRLRKRRYKARLTDGETRTRTISEPLASGGPRTSTLGAAHGETRTRTMSEPLASGGPRTSTLGAAHGETRTRTISEPLASGGPRTSTLGAAHGETRTRTGDTTIFRPRKWLCFPHQKCCKS